MSEDGRFWFGVWSLGASVLIVISLSITATMWDKRNKLSDMVNQGVDPVRAACALDMFEGPTTCLVHNLTFKGENK